MPVDADDRLRVKRLAGALGRLQRGVGRLSEEDLTELPRLYRFGSSLYARLEASGEERALADELRPLLLTAHGILQRGVDAESGGGARGLARRAARYWRQEVPRAVRAEWPLAAASCALLYGLALLAFLLVRDDLGLAYSLHDPRSVDVEIGQLQDLAEGQPFRGNFTFGREESAGTAGVIIGNNLGVAILFFASALLVPLYVTILARNALMLGTYTAVAHHWGQAGAISSILWCHGVLEIQAIVLAGTAGLVLVRGALFPGPWTRRAMLRKAGLRALTILAACLPMLLVAGVLEGWVSPHATHPVRLAVAVGSGVLLLAWLGLSGRVTAPAPRGAPRASS